MGPGRGAGFSGQPDTWPQVPLVEAARALADSSSQTRLRGSRKAVHGRVPEQGQLCLSPFSGSTAGVDGSPGDPEAPWQVAWGPLSQPGPSPSGEAPAERGCSEGRPVLASDRAPDHCPRMSPRGSSHPGGGCPCSRCRMVFPLGCGDGPLLRSHAPPHGSRQGCPLPADVDPPTKADSAQGARVGGCTCARCPQKGRSDRALLTSSSGSSEPRSGCPQGLGLSAQL